MSLPLPTLTPPLPTTCWELDAPWRELRYYEEVGSTQRLAAELVRQGEDLRGVALWAETQTEGIGRTGNHWDSTAGGVYVSAVLPGATLPALPMLSWYPLAAAASCAALLHERYGLATRIKWPNDVLLELGNGLYKLAGVLGELVHPRRAAAGATGSLVVAMGLNWSNRPQVPTASADAATATALEPISLNQARPGIGDDERRAFIVDWLAQLARWHAGLQSAAAATTDELVRAVEPRLWLRGRPVRVADSEHGTLEGQLLGLGASAAARLRLADGRVLNLHCGHLRPE